MPQTEPTPKVKEPTKFLTSAELKVTDSDAKQSQSQSQANLKEMLDPLKQPEEIKSPAAYSHKAPLNKKLPKKAHTDIKPNQIVFVKEGNGQAVAK